MEGAQVERRVMGGAHEGDVSWEVHMKGMCHGRDFMKGMCHGRGT